MSGILNRMDFQRYNMHKGPPPRPLVPPKPSSKPTAATGTQAHFPRRHSVADASTTSPSTMQPARPSAPAPVTPSAPVPHNFRSPSVKPVAVNPGSVVNSNSSEDHTSPTTSPTPVLSSPKISPGGSVTPRNKPALPPKPVVSPSLLNSPPVTKFPPNSKVSPIKFSTQVSTDNTNIVNNNVSSPPPISPSLVANGEQNGNVHSPPPFLRAKPPHARPPPVPVGRETGGDPVPSPRITSPPHSRPNSSAFFNLSSPIQNLNSGNFPSTSAGLNQIGGAHPPPHSVTSPQKLSEIRVKSASLGRNITFPFSSTSTSSGAGSSSSGGGFFTRKSATLSKFLPLDLHIGGGSKPSSVSATPATITSPTRPKPNTFNLNPFIIQQKQQQQQQSQPPMSQANSVLNFGRSIAFSPESPLPPPPPPRLKKKLSPVNSIGSPSSPTSPFPIGGGPGSNSFSLAPTSPLPPPPPISPAAGGCVTQMEAVSELAEDVMAIYAEVNKEKKWADRKLKQEQELTRKLSLDSNLPSPTHEFINNNSPNTIKKSESSQNASNIRKFGVSNDSDPLKPKEEQEVTTESSTSSTNEPETVVVKSWLRTHVNGMISSADSSTTSNANATLSPNNPFRSASPTYQAAKTGHIYETIGETLDGLNNNNNNNNNSSKIGSKHGTDTPTPTEIEIQETSEVIQADELSENKSFLFKLVINPKKVTDAEPTNAEPASRNESSSNNEEMNMKNHSISDAEKSAATDGTNIHKAAGIDTVAVVQSCKTDTICEQRDKADADVVLKASTTTAPSSLPLSKRNGQQQDEEVDGLVEKNDAIGPVNAYLIPTVVQDLSEGKPSLEFAATSTTHDLTSQTDNHFSDELKGRPLLTSNSSFQSTATEYSTTTPTPPIRTSSILRRRSWNCDRFGGSGSPSPSESSSTASSISNLPCQHRRDRSFTAGERGNNRDSLLLRELEWVDEGELSNGVLADAESSDVQLRSSAEDVNFRKVANSTTTASKGFSSRRLVSSIFASFGKGSYSSSGSSGGGRKSTGMRNSNGGRRSNKDKTFSQFLAQDSSKCPRHSDGGPGVAKLGRQISDSVISSTVISPILPNSVSFDSGSSHHKPQSVQFSPEVQETRIIYHREQYSSEEAAIGKNGGICADDNMCVTSSLGTLSIEEGNGVVVDRKDDEISVSSSESVSGCGSISGSVSGYEDILAELSPKEKKSFYVAREILTSERTFVDVLNLITVDFPKSLENAKRFHGAPVISKQDLNIILGGLPNLKQVNENLLSDLEERIVHWKESPKIADILVKKGPFLKLYATYIKDFQKNSMHLDTCCQKYPLFADAVRDFELSERCHKLGLKHYMLKPVQRMPQYRLLLEDYLKSLDKDESNDYEDTVKGIAIVKDVAEHANEAINLQVNAEKLLHLQNRLSTGTIILKADRQLIKEGELLKASRKELQPRFFALMNDSLLCFTYLAAAGSPKDLKLRYELPLAGMRVALSPVEDFQNEFSVISVTRSFNLVAKSTREREDWMKALNNAIRDNIKKRTCSTPDEEIGFQLGKEAPVWIQDSRVTMCQLCTAEFTVTFRRHHCRACGKVVCGNCSSGQAPLQYLNNAANRVCDSCYEYLLDEFDKQTDIDADSRDNRCRASIRDRFKKVTPNVSKRATKIKRNVPSRLEVNANSSGAKISSYLTWREKEKKSWKRRWFVLIDRVLYIYAASEDIVAIKSIPLLGWQVEMDKPDPQQENEDNQSFFRLTHTGQHPISFQADNSALAEKWVAAMGEAVVLS